MGANQSSQNTSVNNEGSGQITVVNSTPNQLDNQTKIVLPERVPPILSINGHNLDNKRHPPEFRLDPQLWVDFVNVINKFSSLRTELIANRQNLLQEKITQLDDYLQKFADLYVQVKHKSLAKLNGDFRKMEDLNNLADKYIIQSKICVDMLNKLNFLLPPEHKLEPFDSELVHEEEKSV